MVCNQGHSSLNLNLLRLISQHLILTDLYCSASPLEPASCEEEAAMMATTATAY